MMREINIRPALNGFVVQIGCQTLVYPSVEELISDLDSYLHEPEQTEKRVIASKGFNRKHTLDPRPGNPIAHPQDYGNRVEAPCDTATGGY